MGRRLKHCKRQRDIDDEMVGIEQDNRHGNEVMMGRKGIAEGYRRKGCLGGAGGRVGGAGGIYGGCRRQGSEVQEEGRRWRR